MKEKYEKTVPFKGITPETMKALLEFLYTETIVLTEENVSDMLYAASIMQVEGNLWLFCIQVSLSLDYFKLV